MTVNLPTHSLFARTGRCLLGGLLERSILGRLRLVAFCTIMAGVFLASLTWWSRRQLDDVLQRGLVAEAVVTKSAVMHGRGNTYLLDVQWRDADGATQQVAGVRVSRQLFDRIENSAPPSAKQVRVQYLADRTPRRWTVALPDDSDWIASMDNAPGFYLPFALVGVVGTVVLSLLRARRMCRDAQIT